MSNPTQCDICKRIFAKSSHLTTHKTRVSNCLDVVHKYKFECEFCGVSYVSDNEVSTHISNSPKCKIKLIKKLTGIDYDISNLRYFCDECGIEFSTSSRLKTHRKRSVTCLTEYTNKLLAIDRQTFGYQKLTPDEQNQAFNKQI